MKDIGSIFPLYEESYKELGKNPNTEDRYRYAVFYSLCSEALYDIAAHHVNGNNKVLIPSYTCHVVSDSFEQVGWTSYFYGITKTMRMDIPNLIDQYEKEHPDILVAHPYYGMDFNKEEEEALRYIKSKGCIIIIDCTQNIFSEQRFPFVDYYVGSLRKWLPIPDAGLLEQVASADILSDISKLSENNQFVIDQKDAMYLRGKYFQTGDELIKSISIRLNKIAEGIEEIRPHRISSFSKKILMSSDLDVIAAQRIENYKVLFENIRDSNNVERVNKEIGNLTTAPLYFPLYVKNRESLQRYLASKHIYCPILWHYNSDSVLVNREVKYIYDHIMVVPLDQRNDRVDMERVASEINLWNR